MLALSLVLLVSAAGQGCAPQCVPDTEVLTPVEQTSIRYPTINTRGPQSSGVVIFDVETDASGAVVSSKLKCATVAPVWVKGASRAVPNWRFQPGKALRGQVVINTVWDE